jgi:hypothetical protein
MKIYFGHSRMLYNTDAEEQETLNKLEDAGITDYL